MSTFMFVGDLTVRVPMLGVELGATLMLSTFYTASLVLYICVS